MIPLRASSGTLLQNKRIDFVVVDKISIYSGPEDGARSTNEWLTIEVRTYSQRKR